MIRHIASILTLALCAGAASAAPVSAPMTFKTDSDTIYTYQMPAASGDSVFVGFDFSYTGTLGNNDFLGMWFGNSSSLGVIAELPNFGIKGNCGDGSCTDDVFVRTNGTAGDFIAGSNLQKGVTYKLFAHLYKSTPSSTFDTFDVWLNPTMHEMNTLTGADMTARGASSITTFDTIGFRTANIDKGVTLNVSNLRVNEVPEPGSVALMGLALAGLAAVRRKRA